VAWGMDWIGLVQYRDGLEALLNAVMKCDIPPNGENFLNG
jgi:hypothetical protein